MRRSVIGVLATCWLLGGCALWGDDEGGRDGSDNDQTRTSAQPGEAAQDACGAGRLDALVGQTLTQSVKQRIVDESQARRYRMLRPGMMQTMDHDPQRLNITLDASGKITAFSCG